MGSATLMFTASNIYSGIGRTRTCDSGYSNLFTNHSLQELRVPKLYFRRKSTDQYVEITISVHLF